MKKSSAMALAVTLLLSVGFTLAYAQKAVKKRKSRGVQRAATLKAVPTFIQPRPPGIPTREQILTQTRMEFLSLGQEGTKVISTPDSKGDPALQNAVARALNNLGLVPPERVTHFQWLSKDPGIRARGWNGNILSVTATNGGWTASVSFSPLIDHLGAGKTVFTGDHVVETYRYDGFNVYYVGSMASPTATRSLIID